MTMPESVRPWDTFECGVCDLEVDAAEVDWVRWEDEYDGAPDAVNRHVCLECSQRWEWIQQRKQARRDLAHARAVVTRHGQRLLETA